MYVEFGATSTDTVTLTNTYVSSGLTTAKKYNILARQISCTAEWKYDDIDKKSYILLINVLGPQQTVFNISREPLEVSSPTTFKAVSFSRDKSTTTV